MFRYHRQDVLQHAEQCNGSAIAGRPTLAGTMSLRYMASWNERIRPGAGKFLRELNPNKANRFDHEEIKEVMDLCLSCKGCKSECPSNEHG